MKKLNPLLKNAAIISVGGLIVKLLGAFYRIPLNNILKADGLGIYQTAFPLYLILMTFSGAAATNAITKIVASGENGEAVVKKAFALILPIGFLGWLFMTFFSGILSDLQGNPRAKLSYIALAPSLVFVSAISVLRGYFQGKNNMKPTVFSQVTEQTVKIGAGLLLCYFFSATPQSGAFFACFAVSLSELCALIYLIAKFRRHPDKTFRLNEKYPVKRLIGQLLPIALTSCVLPLAKVFDSFTAINILNRYAKDANGLYGLYSGSVESLIGMPVAVCYGIAASVLPSLTSANTKGKTADAKNIVVQAFSYTLFLSALAFAAIAFFPNLIIKILFSGLSVESKKILSGLIVFSSINVVLLSVIQTETSVLVASGKPYAPAISLAAGFAVKAVTQIFLLKNPNLNVFGILYSDILCYFVAVFTDLVYIISIYKTRSEQNETDSCGGGRNAGRFIAENLGSDKKI